MIGVDIDIKKINFAKHNAKVYNVQKNIDFIEADFLSETLVEIVTKKYKKIDAVLISPPW